MESLSVLKLPEDHVPVKGPVIVRLHMGLREFPPSIRIPDHRDAYRRSHRYIEFEALSPSLADLDKAATFLRNKYNRGTTHIAFETLDIYTVNGKTTLELGYGS